MSHSVSLGLLIRYAVLLTITFNHFPRNENSERFNALSNKVSKKPCGTTSPVLKVLKDSLCLIASLKTERTLMEYRIS